MARYAGNSSVISSEASWSMLEPRKLDQFLARHVVHNGSTNVAVALHGPKHWNLRRATAALALRVAAMTAAYVGLVGLHDPRQ